MIDLTLDLDTTDFETLFELGRSLIPATAPAWTDHNTHDPGIMLLELAAWLADAQIYSLARLRHDERLAYAGFIGIASVGPTPARGLIWPAIMGDAPAPWPAGTRVSEETEVVANLPGSVSFYPTRALQLSTARLTRLYSRFSDGTLRDWTQINSRAGVTFQPFGSNPTNRDSLILALSGPLASLDGEPTAHVSVGFEVVRDTLPVMSVSTNPIRGSRNAVAASISDSGGARPVTVVEDTTDGLLRSGVLVLRIDAAVAPIDYNFSLILRPAAQTLLVSPFVRRIAMNVLPIVQQASVVDEIGKFGTGFPDQVYQLRTPGLVWSGSDSPVMVRIQEEEGWQDWKATDDLSSCDPMDRCFALDEQAQTLTFGNGINGRMPPTGAPLEAVYKVTAADAGNIQAGIQWRVDALPGLFGYNTEATTGGTAGQSLDDLRGVARQRVRMSRPYVTSDDLIAAVLAMSDLGVVRAFEVAPAADSQRSLPGARVLVVGRGHDANSVDRAEPSLWLEEIRARVAPKLPLGQFLRVTGPVYVDIGITAVLVAAPNVDPASVAAAALTKLESALAITGAAPWPFGREVAPLSIKGWLRKLPGVATVADVRLFRNGQDTLGKPATVPATGLPLLKMVADDIVVQRWPGSKPL